MNQRTLYVVAVPLVAEHLLSIEDQNVKGLYEANALPGNVSDAHAASLAHAAFHWSIAVSNPGDFSVVVFDPLSRQEMAPDSFGIQPTQDCIKVQSDVLDWMVDAVEATQWVKTQKDPSPGL